MCGIAGIYNLDGKPLEKRLLQKMADTMKHRGPDDEGYYLDKNIGFAHRRLSIIDLSPAGHQPMANEDKSIWIIHNGEIYNYLELKEDLRKRGHRFKSDTDTEVILHAYEEWGEGCLQKFNGMWAFAIWDKREKKLFCARDRFGIKPFYYYFDGKTFVFASEIKGILQAGIPRGTNNQIVYDYLVNSYTDHAEETFFLGIKQLLASHYLVVRNSSLKISRYWELSVKDNQNLKGSKEYAERFRELFIDSVRLRLRSDVPIGTCLSGGLDSSSIVCVANGFLHGYFGSSLGDRQQSFSAVYDNKECDERTFIKRVVEKTGIVSHYTFPTVKDLLKDLDNLIWYQEEPFQSTSVYAQYCVFRTARENGVKVILDGQGGDETLAGYNFYFFPFYNELIRRLKFCTLWKEIVAYWSCYGFHDFIRIVTYYPLFFPDWMKSFLKKCFRRKPSSFFRKEFLNEYGEHLTSTDKKFEEHFAAYIYNGIFLNHLPHLLHWEDRNSMTFSIESRVPFLDHRLVEFCFSLPVEQLIDKGWTKVILRNGMKGVLPEEVRTRRDKIGFAVPEKDWIRNGLEGLIEDIINSRSFEERDYFNIREVRKGFLEYLAGRRNDSGLIWRCVNLELWMRKFMD